MVLTRISHGPVRNAHEVPTSVGVSRESFRPGKRPPKQLATGDLLTNRKICEKVRLTPVFPWSLSARIASRIAARALVWVPKAVQLPVSARPGKHLERPPQWDRHDERFYPPPTTMSVTDRTAREPQETRASIAIRIPSD